MRAGRATRSSIFSRGARACSGSPLARSTRSCRGALPSSTSGAKRRKKRTAEKPGTANAARAARESGLPSDYVAFAHISERQFARLLDFYQIAWDYEPRSFDVDWDEAGKVVKRFTPDFYLP